MRITAITNQKGGVGKTTVAAGLAEALARGGKRVLCVDLDPQANLTAHLGVELGDGALTVGDALYVDPNGGGKIDRGILAEVVRDAGGAWQGLVDVVPSALSLANREQDQVLGREMRLRTALAGPELDSAYDDVIIDCPPSLGQLTANAMLAATHVLCVTEPRANSVEGLRQMWATIDQVADPDLRLNPGLVRAGIVVNRFRSDRIDPVAWLGKLQDEYGSALIDPTIPEREFIAKASTEATPLADFPAPPGIRTEVLGSFVAIAARLDTVTGR